MKMETSVRKPIENLLKRYRNLHNLLSAENQTLTFYNAVYQSIQETIDRIPTGARIAIRCSGEHTRFLIKYVDLTRLHVVGIFDKAKREEDFYGYRSFGLDELSGCACDYVLLSSHIFRREIKEELHRGGYRVIDIYDDLEKKGIYLRAPFYRYRPQGHEVFNYYYMDYLEKKGSEQHGEALKKALLAAIEAKDFQYVLKLCRENAAEKEKYPFIGPAKAAAADLLEWIGAQLAGRAQKDIILFWTDAVSSDMLKYLPWLEKRSKDSCFFERVYAQTPFTHPTFRAMLSGLLPIDDYEKSCEKISEKNSWVLKYLKSHGYEFKHIGFDGADYNSAEDEYLVNMELNSSCNEIFWQAVCSVLSTERQVFYMLHFMAETHPPLISPDLHEMNYDVNSKNCHPQLDIAYRYMDEHLMTYSRLFGDKTQIFLSDHGTNLRFPTYSWTEERLRTYLFITGRDIPIQKVKGFFSYARFYYLVRWLVEPDKYNLEDALAENVIFQDVDNYSEALIERAVRMQVPDCAFSYRGVVEEGCKYVVNANGKEFYYILEDGREIPATPSSQERDRLIEMCGDYFLDVFHIEKFKYSRKLYDTFGKGDAKL